MKRSTTFSRRTGAALLSAVGVWLLGSCQSIAGVEEVEFLGDDTVSPECVEYCDSVLEACAGDLTVYEDRATCEATCGTFDATDPSVDADTLACRLEQARLAKRADSTTEKSAHCPGAGPGGGAACKSETEAADCEGYCSLYMQACESIRKDWGFDNKLECIKKCEVLTPAGEYSAKEPPVGDTLACRLFYASRSALDPSLDNCKTASLYPYVDLSCHPLGEPDCDHYCQLVELACDDGLEVYESTEQCKQVCLNTEPGTVLDTGGQDTVGCRTYHAYNAMALKQRPHCSHSGPAGNGVCSFVDDGNCIPYCRLAKAGCGELFDEQYEDDAACLDDCRTIEGATPDAMVNAYSVATAQTGNTLQCRILHAARALEKPDDRVEFCRSVFGGAPCKD